jgi:hypothetical protein
MKGPLRGKLSTMELPISRQRAIHAGLKFESRRKRSIGKGKQHKPRNCHCGRRDDIAPQREDDVSFVGERLDRGSDSFAALEDENSIVEVWGNINHTQCMLRSMGRWPSIKFRDTHLYLAQGCLQPDSNVNPKHLAT